MGGLPRAIAAHKPSQPRIHLLCSIQCPNIVPVVRPNKPKGLSENLRAAGAVRRGARGPNAPRSPGLLGMDSGSAQGTVCQRKLEPPHHPLNRDAHSVPEMRPTLMPRALPLAGRAARANMGLGIAPLTSRKPSSARGPIWTHAAPWGCPDRTRGKTRLLFDRGRRWPGFDRFGQSSRVPPESSAEERLPIHSRP